MDAAPHAKAPLTGRRGLSVKTRIVTGFTALCLLFAVSVALSSWQQGIHRADLHDLDQHSSRATALQEVEAQASIAALLVQRYVVTGDENLIPEIRQHTQAATDSETALVTEDAPPVIADIVAKGAALAQGAAGVIALRQAGDAEGAAAAMEGIVPIFREFRLTLEAATAEEIARVDSLRISANRAGDNAFLILLLSGAIGITMAIACAYLISRSVIGPLSTLEATAVAASDGDLSVRAPVNGPRELARFGEALNQMMAAVETHTQELSAAYEEIKERNHQLTDARAQAATDPLTGLGNHRAFHKRIHEVIGAARDAQGSISMVLFDVDGFKIINDSMGHLAGDEVLRQLSAAICGVVQRSDAYRYGGDEFSVLLAGADHREAIVIAEKMRVAVESISTDDGRGVTISLGVASFPEMASTSEELIYRADMAMYWAKSTGKNRVGDWDGLLSRRGENGAGPQGSAARRDVPADVVASLIAALSAKDPTTREHTERCSWYAAELARDMGLSEQQSEQLRLACLLHDIGKLAVPDGVLLKPGPLDDGEWQEMRRHPVLAQHILSQVDSVAEAVPAILHHHERFDGKGYPSRLAGEEIPLVSRILSVTDAFDAMTSDRPYRKAISVDDALEELRRNAGSQFDPVVVERFTAMIARNGTHPLRHVGHTHA